MPDLKSYLSDQNLADRFHKVRDFARTIRVSEYYMTHACNIRCEGCWFFSHDLDKHAKDETDLEKIRGLLQQERKRGVNTALVIGGEPTLFPARLKVYVDEFKHLFVGTNGLRPLPKEGFERVAIALSVFGGGKLDDQLRARKPNGDRFEGLFDQALRHYRDDERVVVVFALSEVGVQNIEETVRKVRDHGLHMTFGYYSSYHKETETQEAATEKLLEEALRVKDAYKDVVLSHPYYIESLIRGRTSWGKFGYDSCPSISTSHPKNEERLKNGNPYLPRFNAYASDLKTLNVCCTSGECAKCRDSQAIMSWLMSNFKSFLGSKEDFRTWVEICESYWAQFVWSPFNRANASKPEVSVHAGLRVSEYQN